MSAEYLLPIPESHRRYIRMRDYPLGIEGTHIFSEQEQRMLMRYGYWFEALATGAIEPLTEAQHRFIRVHHDQERPESAYEWAWWRLVERRIWEAPKSADPAASWVGPRQFEPRLAEE